MMAGTKNAPVFYDVPRVSQLFKIDTELSREVGEPPPPINGYLTFFDVGLSIVQLRESVERRRRIFYPHDWFDHEEFARRTTPPAYRQLRMEAVPDSFHKTFAEQQTLCEPDEEIPATRVVVMGMVIHFLATRERMFSNYCVRTKDVSSDGGRVFVGYFDAEGFDLDIRGNGRHGHLGLASARTSRSLSQDALAAS